MGMLAAIIPRQAPNLSFQWRSAGIHICAAGRPHGRAVSPASPGLARAAEPGDRRGADHGLAALWSG